MLRIYSPFQNVKSFLSFFRTKKIGAQHESPHAKQTFEGSNYPRNISISSKIGRAFEKNYLNASNKTCSPERIPKSTSAKITAAKAAITKTMTVVKSTSRRVGQTTLDTSERTCWINCNGLLIAMERPFKVMPHIMRFAVTFNPWSHQIARSYPSSRAKLFRAEAAMPNTYLQNLWNGRSFEQTVLRRRTKKNCQPTRFNLALTRAVSKPMRLANTVTRKAWLCSRPIAVQRQYFPLDARALNMLFQAAHKFAWTHLNAIQATQPVLV